MLSDEEVRNLLLDPMTDWFYLGQVNDGLIESFLHLVESKPVFRNLSRPGRRRLINAMVESLQNIRNNTPDDVFARPGAVVFMQRQGDDIWTLRCGNIMRSIEVQGLRMRIELINATDQSRLRELYIAQMHQTLTDGSRNSAGLGLIEMARASSAPIRYRFIPLADPYTFFAVELELTLK
jgi:hypothetical protein